jgi:hypothetical protein
VSRSCCKIAFTRDGAGNQHAALGTSYLSERNGGGSDIGHEGETVVTMVQGCWCRRVFS